MDLVAALAYAHDKEHGPFRVTFDLTEVDVPGDSNSEFWNQMVEKNHGRFQAIVLCLEHEDGSGESFNIAGYLNLSSNPKCFGTPFTGYYCTRTRKGALQFKVLLADDKKVNDK